MDTLSFVFFFFNLIFFSSIIIKLSYTKYIKKQIINLTIQIYRFRAFPQVFKRVCQGKISTPFTLINGGLFSSPTNVGHRNLSPLGASVLANTLSFLQSMWDCPQIHPLWGQRLYWHTASCLPPSGNSEKAGTLSDVWL